MAKKRNKEQELKRQIEALKAQMKITEAKPQAKAAPFFGSKNSETSEKNEKYILPVGEIKKDLFKTVLYALFSFVVLVIIKYLNPLKTGL